MGIFSRFENKMEDTLEGAADKVFDSPISPVQIAKKAEKQMKREKMVGAGKQYAPTLYTVLVNPEDDDRLFGYYPTLAGETETYLTAKAANDGLVMDGQPLVRFIVDEGLKRGKFEVIAEMVAAPIVSELRAEEMERYGIAPKPQPQPAPRPRPRPQGGRPAGGQPQGGPNGARPSRPFPNDPAAAAAGRAAAAMAGAAMDAGVQSGMAGAAGAAGAAGMAGAANDVAGAAGMAGAAIADVAGAASAGVAGAGAAPDANAANGAGRAGGANAGGAKRAANTMSAADMSAARAQIPQDVPEPGVSANASAYENAFAEENATNYSNDHQNAGMGAPAQNAAQKAAQNAAPNAAPNAAQNAAPAPQYDNQYADYDQYDQYDNYNNGYEQPYDQGYAQPYNQSYDNGYDQGYNAGYDDGYYDNYGGGQNYGYDQPYDNYGYQDNYQDGYQDNYQDGYQENAIPNTMMFNPVAQKRQVSMPGRHARARLIDNRNQRTYTLAGRISVIGRETTCNIVVNDINASRKHAEVRSSRDGFWDIIDLNSTNGTYVNGRPIDHVTLREGDRITIGMTNLIFTMN